MPRVQPASEGDFEWSPQPQAERFISKIVSDVLARCPPAADLAARMKEQTGTRFSDWIGHIVLPGDDPRRGEVESAGYVRREITGQRCVYDQPRGMFPTIVLDDANGLMEVAVKVESVADFLAAVGIEPPIQGQPLSDVRVAHLCCINGMRLGAIERHGNRSFDPPDAAPARGIQRLIHFERFRMRRRKFEDEAAAFEHAADLIDAAIADLGVDLACEKFFVAEREYWQRRNRAAQVQKARQDRLGLGWANHDHHTYRSSREWFTRLISVFEKLGFHCRERFYAGREAGWGAQVLEQPNAGIVIFADVDLSPDELMTDFAHEPLPPRSTLGTVGLWCALHGEAFLKAGLHHLECQFDFDALKAQLQAEAGITTMKPFTDLPYLRQAFTEGQRWPVSQQRLERALHAGYISNDQARQFREKGAIGSHLENLERKAGFKGFNQAGVSQIIAATDPRKQQNKPLAPSGA